MKAYLIILKLINIAEIKSKPSPHKKNTSAIFSSCEFLASLLLRIERKERMQLVINMIMAKEAISSRKVASRKFSTLIDVSTIKHSPNKLEEAFKT